MEQLLIVTGRVFGVAFKPGIRGNAARVESLHEPETIHHRGPRPSTPGTQARVGAPLLLSAERQIPAEPPPVTLLLLSIEKCNRLNYIFHGQHNLKDELCHFKSILNAPDIFLFGFLNSIISVM